VSVLSVISLTIWSPKSWISTRKRSMNKANCRLTDIIVFVHIASTVFWISIQAVFPDPGNPVDILRHLRRILPAATSTNPTSFVPQEFTLFSFKDACPLTCPEDEKSEPTGSAPLVSSRSFITTLLWQLMFSVFKKPNVASHVSKKLKGGAAWSLPMFAREDSRSVLLLLHCSWAFGTIRDASTLNWVCKSTKLRVSHMHHANC
jgi:hypothetical protein